jgi:hypothetical protein
MRSMCKLAAGVLLVVLPSMARAGEVATNGGFETAGAGGATESSGWSVAASGGAGSLSERSSTSPRTGGFAHHLITFAGDNIGGNSSVSQNSAANAVSLQQSTTLSASYYGKYTLGPGGVGFYVLRILNSAGGIVTQTGLGVITNGTGGAYQNYTMGPINVPAFGAPPNDAYYAYIELNVAAGAFAGSTAEAYVDDVSINGTILGGALTGACCVANVCSVTAQAACTGTYQSDGTTCSPDPCAPPVTGACCTTTGTCTVTTQAACTASFRGASTVCLPNPCPVTNELASNGGFETAGFGGPTDSFTWNANFSGGPGSLSQRDGTMPNTGGFAHHLLTFGADAIGGNAAVSQNTTTDGGMQSLQENTPVTATYRGKYTFGPGGVGFYVLRVLNGSGAIVAATPLGVINAGTNGSYQTYSTGTVTVPAFGAPPNDVYSAFIELNVAAGAFVGASAEAYIDDVSISGTFATGGGPTNGVCCRGSTCSITTQAACTAGAFGGAAWSAAAACNDASNPTTPCCKADYNKANGISVQDIFDYLAAWFASDLTADTNGDSTIAVQDIFDFLNAWFSGCP